MKFNNLKSTGFLPFIITLIASFPYILYLYRDKVIDLLINQEYVYSGVVKYLLTNDNMIFRFFLMPITAFIIFIIPYICATFYEIYQLKGSIKKRLLLTSIYQIFNSSNDYKFADIIYTFIKFFIQQFPILIVLSTIGISNFNAFVSSNAAELLTSSVGSIINNINTSFLIVFLLLILDLVDFLKHWLQHNVPFLWDFHEFHHSATQMNMLSENRVNLFEGVFIETLFLPANIFVGLVLANYYQRGDIVPIIVYLFYIISVKLVGIFGHSKTMVIYPKYVSLIFMSPSLHFIHHSSNPEHYNKNLGLMFTFWDRLAGTYLPEKEIANVTSFGVNKSLYNDINPLKSYFLIPLIKISKRLNRLFLIHT